MKSFDAIIGHKKISSHFEEAIKTGKVSHAYLLSGEDGSGKMMIVRQMQIYWGVRPFKSHKAETTKDLLDEATDIVLDAGLAEKDDILVLTGGGPANHRGKGVTNMLKVVKIGEFGE